jgi:hypothetical protein
VLLPGEHENSFTVVGKLTGRPNYAERILKVLATLKSRKGTPMSRKNRRGVALKAKKSKLGRLRALMATLHRHGGIKKTSPKGGAARQQVATMLRAHRRRARRKPFFGDGPKAQSTPVTQARFVTHDLKEKVKHALQREKSLELFRKGRAARAARDAQDALLRAAAQAIDPAPLYIQRPHAGRVQWGRQAARWIERVRQQAGQPRRAAPMLSVVRLISCHHCSIFAWACGFRDSSASESHRTAMSAASSTERNQKRADSA